MLENIYQKSFSNLAEDSIEKELQKKNTYNAGLKKIINKIASTAEPNDQETIYLQMR